MKLNPGQNEAVKFVSGPCLVLAGAGSGKTGVICQKIAYLIQKCDYKARNIAAVTFTNKAAREMKERIQKMLGRDLTRGLTVSTFHSLGLDIVRREIKILGYKPGFTLFDDQDSLALLKELTLDELDGDKDLLSKLQSKISNWKNDLFLPDDALKAANDADSSEYAEFYQRYHKHMKAYNALDFDDLILIPTLLMKNYPEVRERWQNKIRYLLVDEYQDTNASQYELVKHITGERGRLTVVGDDDQSIYSWRGAKPENLILLGKDFPALKLIKLEQNYRSSGRILKCANVLIANNPHVYDKALFSELAYGVELRVIQAKNEENEIERVIGELIGHRFMNRSQYKDYAVLYRGNHQSRLLEKALMQNRIPYKISGGTSFFSRPEIKDVMAYLRVLVNPDDDNAFLRIVNVPKRELGPATLEKLGTYANMRQISMFAASFELGLEQTLSGRGLVNLQHEVSSLNTMLAISLLDKSSASERLSGVAYSRSSDVTNPILQDKLVELIQSDKSTSVRLAVLNRLQEMKSIEKYSEQLLLLVNNESNVLVQISLCRLLLSNGSTETITQLKKLLSTTDLNPEVREILQADSARSFT